MVSGAPPGMESWVTSVVFGEQEKVLRPSSLGMDGAVAGEKRLESTGMLKKTINEGTRKEKSPEVSFQQKSNSLLR